MKSISRNLVLIAGFFFIFQSSVGASELIYSTPGFTLIRGTTIGVAPLQNLTQSGSAGDRVSSLIANIFAESRMFRVYGEDVFKTRMQYNGLNPSLPVDRSISVKIGQQTGMNYVIFGSVIEYGYQLTPQGTRTLPIAGIDIRIVDVSSGKIIFAGSFTKEGTPGTTVDHVAMDAVKAFYEKVMR